MTTATEQQIAAHEAKCQQTLAPWWEQADILPHYPATTTDVVEILRANEYAVQEVHLLRMVADGFVSPLKRDGRHWWSAADVVDLAARLEVRRQWAMNSKLHDHKKHPAQLAREAAERDGTIDEVRRCAEQHSIEELLVFIVECDDRHAREALFVTLQLKAEGFFR